MGQKTPSQNVTHPWNRKPSSYGISMQRKIKQLIKILQNGRQRISSQEVRRDLLAGEEGPA